MEVTIVADGAGCVVTVRHGGLPATLRGETTRGGVVLGRLAVEAAGRPREV
ncbi:hypothetical protein [Jiangella asiatica]|uniref:hypothetical protein n=1 Tax=Jiangella asiatica TaxID=2530372 RepID=UPI0013A5C4E8|nr:hypothetical protein [Jiangella asiatica]